MTKIHRLIAMTVCLVVGVLLASHFFTHNASAASNYSLISNEIYLNKNAMSQPQIQSFLEGKNSALKSYKDQGVNNSQPELASVIIYNASQAWGINPQVILATLQKEQSLITKQNPTSIDYRSAMGYGCPDGADCNAKYFGFANQVNIAAYQFRYNYEALRGNSSFIDGDGDIHSVGTFACAQADGGNTPPFYNNALLPGNTVTFSRNVAVSGTIDSTVTISNEATASLLCYTPHVGPYNSTGYSGSDNFIYWFTQWFGSPNGVIIRTNEDGRFYVLGANNTYYYIVNQSQLSALGYGTSIKSFYSTNKITLQSMTFAGDLPGTVRFNGGSEVYALDGGKKHYYSYDAYQAYSQPAVGNLAAGLSEIIPTGSPMTTVVRNNNSQELYNIQNGKKRYIGGPDIYQKKGLNTIAIKPLTDYFFSSIPLGAPILSPGTIVKTSDTNKTYLITNDSSARRNINSSAAISISIGVYMTKSSEILQLAQDPNTIEIGLLVKNSLGNLYITDGTSKITVSSSQLDIFNRTSDDFIVVDNSYLDNFSTKKISDSLLIRIGTNDRVYNVKQGRMLSIETASDFDNMGYKYGDVISLAKNTTDSIFINNNESLVLPGTLFRVNNTEQVYLYGEDGKTHLIANANTFNDFGFSWSSVRKFNSATYAYHPNGDPLRHIVRTPDNAYWLITDGKRLWIPENLREHYIIQLDDTTPVTISTLSTQRPSNNATSFVRIGNNDTVYRIVSGKKSALSLSKFYELGGTFNKVNSVSSQTASTFATDTPTY